MPMIIRIAAVQYSTAGMSRTDGLDKAMHTLDDAAHVADVVLLPNNSFFDMEQGIHLKDIAVTAEGALVRMVSQIALLRNCHVCFSTVERDGDKFFNTSMLVGAEGRLLGKQRKINLTEDEWLLGITAGEDISVFDSMIGRISMLALDDLSDERGIKNLMGKETDLLLMPSNIRHIGEGNAKTTAAACEHFLRRVAIARRTQIAFANKVDGGDAYIGSSMIIGSEGSVMAKGSIDLEENVRAETQMRHGESADFGRAA